MKPKRCSTSQCWSQILLVIFGGVIASQNSGKLENQQNQINPSVPQLLLVHFIDSLMVAVDKGLGVVVVLIDLSAAFDSLAEFSLISVTNMFIKSFLRKKGPRKGLKASTQPQGCLLK